VLFAMQCHIGPAITIVEFASNTAKIIFLNIKSFRSVMVAHHT